MKNPSNPDEIIFLANPTLRIGKPWNIRRKPWLYSLPKRFGCRADLPLPSLFQDHAEDAPKMVES